MIFSAPPGKPPLIGHSHVCVYIILCVYIIYVYILVHAGIVAQARQGCGWVRAVVQRFSLAVHRALHFAISKGVLM